MKIEVELVRETRNRQFYTVRANDRLICTHVWEKPHADMIADAVKEYAEKHGEQAVLSVLDQA
jgi:predicted SAM-dependent methyltransferase